jgi:segregation and condensation protein B
MSTDANGGSDDERLSREVEALLFLSPDPLGVADLCDLVQSAPGPVQRALGLLERRHGPSSGLEVAEVAGGFALRTRAEVADACDRLRNRPAEDKLSPAALETLAVIAYLEPVGRPEISRLRGVQVDGVVASLLDRGLIEEAGRSDPGAPMAFRTTRAFQERFNLKGPGDLPPLERFELTGPEAEGIRRRLAEFGHLSADDDAGD